MLIKIDSPQMNSCFTLNELKVFARNTFYFTEKFALRSKSGHLVKQLNQVSLLVTVRKPKVNCEMS
jgi:hypothetical protein